MKVDNRESWKHSQIAAFHAVVQSTPSSARARSPCVRACGRSIARASKLERCVRVSFRRATDVGSSAESVSVERRRPYIKADRAGGRSFFVLNSQRKHQQHQSSCLDEAKEERDSEKEAPSVTEKYFVITSRESRNRRSVVLLAEAVSSVSRV